MGGFPRSTSLVRLPTTSDSRPTTTPCPSHHTRLTASTHGKPPTLSQPPPNQHPRLWPPSCILLSRLATPASGGHHGKLYAIAPQQRSAEIRQEHQRHLRHREITLWHRSPGHRRDLRNSAARHQRLLQGIPKERNGKFRTHQPHHPKRDRSIACARRECCAAALPYAEGCEKARSAQGSDGDLHRARLRCLLPLSQELHSQDRR